MPTYNGCFEVLNFGAVSEQHPNDIELKLAKLKLFAPYSNPELWIRSEYRLIDRIVIKWMETFAKCRQ